MREPADLLASLASLADLETETVDRPDRHRSLHATLEWSLRQLRPDEYRLLAVLTAFRGGAAMVHVRQLAADLEDLDASVAVLVDAQLIAVIDRYGPRITMLDTIREVAADLVEAGPVRAAHAAHFAQLLRQAGAAAEVDPELDNVRAALDWIVHYGRSDVDVRLITALSGYFRDRGYFPEAYRVLSALAAAAEDPATRAHAQCGAGIAANENGEPAEALRRAELAAASFAVAGDAAGQCTALALLGNASKALGDYPRARTAHTECLALARAHAVTRAVTVALNNLGTVAEDLGDYDAARTHYAESLAIKAELGDDRGVAVAHSNLGGLAAEIGEFAVAQEHLRRAAAALEARGERHALAFSLAMLSQAELGCGDATAARDAAERSRELAAGVEYGPGVGLALARLGDLARDGGDDGAAADLYREALNRPIGLPETIRTLERLAAATVRSDPEPARLLLDEATRLRTTHHLPPSPTARAVLREIELGSPTARPGAAELPNRDLRT
jgi:tetratricopeptide (TPR) repeat protein